MSIEIFLILVTATAGMIGALLSRIRWNRLFWALLVAVVAVCLLSIALIWRPVNDDPYPALMILVIGVYGAGAAALGMAAGRLLHSVLGARGRRD
ncbi:hypothetical protein [Ovoidimarina sediminis]|uniref:hypothetical protein n=1 Tax=Ovoidimarina sediminis TaxID=3079856 RepID=UPI0029104035|nr:hypothetical protein [Rhodophyticola sp. MJ-SS7]MDU8943876.1 hypothetical protein [Rhodophyticola sp. MJ-SS7]